VVVIVIAVSSNMLVGLVSLGANNNNSLSGGVSCNILKGLLGSQLLIRVQLFTLVEIKFPPNRVTQLVKEGSGIISEFSCSSSRCGGVEQYLLLGS
jgi:hypothetical protein